jgi:CheY-like chemotaxis protein
MGMSQPSVRLVVVADHDPGARELMAMCFEREGYRVLRASDGLEALSLILDRRPALAVLDVRMRGLSGGELMEWRRERAKTRSMPVLLVNASAPPQRLARRRPEPHQFLAKPLPLAQRASPGRARRWRQRGEPRP